VNVEDLDNKAEIILVKVSFELLVEQLLALDEAGTAPGIE